MPTTAEQTIDARREAHRLLRLTRGVDAARYSVGAPSMAVEPSEEFSTVAEWRAFLEPLYPAWAVAIGVELYEPEPRGSGRGGLFPPRQRRWIQRNQVVIDMKWAAAHGRIGADGLWKCEPGEPLGDIPPAIKPHRQKSARDRMKVEDDAESRLEALGGLEPGMTLNTSRRPA